MVKYNNKKLAYTMLEACIVMLIVSIFIAVTANVIPHRSKAKPESVAHGRFECYYDGGRLYQQQIVEGNSNGRVAVGSYCSFTPPKYIKFLIINVVGGASLSGGSTGEFASTFYSVSDSQYRIYPGAAGTSASGDENGHPTIVQVCNDNACSSPTTAIEAAGGRYTNGDNGFKNTRISDIIRCIVEPGPQIADSPNYNCGSAPMCEIEGNRVKISFCRTNELYKTVYIPYIKQSNNNLGDYYENETEKDLLDTQYIVNSTYPRNDKWVVDPETGRGTLLYYDTSFFSDYGKVPGDTWNPETDTLNPSLYKVILTLRVDQSNSKSTMEKYIDMMQLQYSHGTGINQTIRTAKPGSIGGARSYPGAALILW